MAARGCRLLENFLILIIVVLIAFRTLERSGGSSFDVWALAIYWQAPALTCIGSFEVSHVNAVPVTISMLAVA